MMTIDEFRQTRIWLENLQAACYWLEPGPGYVYLGDIALRSVTGNRFRWSSPTNGVLSKTLATAEKSLYSMTKSWFSLACTPERLIEVAAIAAEQASQPNAAGPPRGGGSRRRAFLPRA